MENKGFKYTYSAPSEAERKEIDSIRKQYAPKEYTETKLERLRRLDSLVRNKANIFGLVFGIVGVLLFGAGLAFILEMHKYVLGLILSVAGVLPMAFAYPVYQTVLKGQKRKYGEEILRLSEELLGREDSER
ncbi:MAG: hypothetical protein IJX88_05360 [Clostridia bacterium]|nr:hypothetical protein [Clostridia bacterium]